MYSICGHNTILLSYKPSRFTFWQDVTTLLWLVFQKIFNMIPLNQLNLDGLDFQKPVVIVVRLQEADRGQLPVA